jgi:multiple sugar transport system substrate-binding protein
MIQYGYWFSAMAESEVTAGQVVMLPGPTWSGKRRDPTMTATGMIMAAASKVPDQAWTVFEWFNGGEPSVGRASSGWGVPALKSQYALMPNETEFQQHVQEVLKGELDLATPPIQFNPYLSEMAFGNSWSQNMLRSLQGEFGFDQFLKNVESEVNMAIEEGIDRIG